MHGGGDNFKSQRNIMNSIVKKEKITSPKTSFKRLGSDYGSALLQRESEANPAK